MGFFCQIYIALRCVFIKAYLHWTHGLPPSAMSPGLPPYYLTNSNAFTFHAPVNMLVNCLVYRESAVLPVAVKKTTSENLV